MSSGKAAYMIVGVRSAAHLKLSLWTPLLLLQSLFFGAVHVGLGYSVRCSGGGCVVCRGGQPLFANERHLLWVHVTEAGGVEIQCDYLPCDPHWRLYRLRIESAQHGKLVQLMRQLNGCPYNRWAWLNAVPGSEMLGSARGLPAEIDDQPLSAKRIRAQKTYFCSELVAAVLVMFKDDLAQDPALPAPRNCWPHHIEAALRRLLEKTKHGRRKVVELLRTPDGELTAENFDDADRRIQALVYGDGGGV